MWRTSMVLCLALLLFVAAAISPAGTPSTTQSANDQKDMERWWDDLAKDEPWNAQTILQLSDRPKQTVALFNTHLQPLKIEQKRLDELKQALSSENEKVWAPAFRELQYFDPRLNEDPTTMLEAVTDPLEKTRLVEILEDSSADRWKGYDVSCTYNTRNTQIRMYKNRSWGTLQISNKISQLGMWNTQWQRVDRSLVILQHICRPMRLNF